MAKYLTLGMCAEFFSRQLEAGILPRLRCNPAVLLSLVTSCYVSVCFGQSASVVTAHVNDVVLTCARVLLSIAKHRKL